jgi:hypothetical protein
MPRAGFYNDNEYRAYPFIYKKEVVTPSLPDASIVDCGIIMGLDSQYDAETHTVWLAAIRRINNVLEFEFATSAPGAANKPLIFTRAVDAVEWLTEQADSNPADDKDCATEPAWEGFLVTGVLTELAAALAPNTAYTFAATDYVLEPSRIQSLVKSYLRSISLGNYSRVVAYPPEECGGPAQTEPRKIVINKKCMQGDLKFKEGHNCEITQVDRNNEIIIGAALGAGEGGNNICEEIKLFENEAPPEGSKLLSGGPACDEIIFTVNGVNYEGSLQLQGGTGVVIRQDPDNPHGLIIEKLDNILVSGCGT